VPVMQLEIRNAVERERNTDPGCSCRRY